MVSITYRKACVKLTDDVYEPAEDSFCSPMPHLDMQKKV